MIKRRVHQGTQGGQERNVRRGQRMIRCLHRSWLPCAMAATLIACGGSQGRRAGVKPEPMPVGGNFGGTWFSPQYGELRLTVSGPAVTGTYEKDERTGRIQGTTQGNLLRFEWEEYRELIA